MTLDRIKSLPLVRGIYRLPWLLGAYHYALSFLGALAYGFPSRRLAVIGVTGTKGKTTTAHLIAHILNTAGMKCGLATTVHFGIGGTFWPNDLKQTMPGRFALQKLLRRMVREECTHAVIETSSEGIAQHRQRFVDYRVAVFTNLSPEHIERHGGFENYRAAKVKLFEQVARRQDGIGVYNLDDKHVGDFLEPTMPVRWGYTLGPRATGHGPSGYRQDVGTVVEVTDLKLRRDGNSFTALGEKFETPLVGEFNVYNAAAAIAAAAATEVPIEEIRTSLRSVPPVPGRIERVEAGQPFTVIVDYAHEPASLEAIYRAARIWDPKRMIGLLGAQGGGRDRWKREAMGRVAGRHLDVVVLANEDPYDEDPAAIIEEVANGVERERSRGPRGAGQELHKIVDRREAIRKALSLAGPGDIVLFTGKGGEVLMCVDGGRKVSWEEKKVVEEELGALFPKSRASNDRSIGEI